MIVSGIYKITSPASKIYIGKSNDINQRWQTYRRYGAPAQPLLNDSFLKFGVDKHTFEIIEECDCGVINEKEAYYQKLIETVNTDHGLNCGYGSTSITLKANTDIHKQKQLLKDRELKQTKRLQDLSSKLSVVNKGWVRNFYFINSKFEFGNYQASIEWLTDNGYSWSKIEYDDVIIPIRSGIYNENEIPKFTDLDDQDLTQINGVIICKEWKYGDVEIITFIDKRIINTKNNS